MIQPSPEVKALGAWGRFTLWVSSQRPLARLVVFLAFLPPYLRIAFWNGFQSHIILASMLLVFILLATSLVWSAGQQIDAWAFLFFNVWGLRPIWLDRIMSGFTQIGSAVAALVIALILYLAGDHLLSYELILGTLTLWLVVELVKFVIYRSRPYIRLIQARIVGYRNTG